MKRTLYAPAKINLCLYVLARRPDGYHDLAMLMQRISLFDELTLSLTDRPGVRVVCEGLGLAPGERNIAARAAERMLALTGKNCGVEIVIDKQIPVAAGLGGGSSDAAAVLKGLDQMLGAGLGRDRLRVEGARLGADVPFFIFEQSAWATGIGDVLEPVEGLPPVWYLLVNPGVAVSTAWVYQNLRLTSPVDVAKLPRFPRTAGDLARFLSNDLERVTTAKYPVVEKVKSDLLSLGAAGALMSGSGPTVFGVFEREEDAQRALGAISREAGWRAFVVRPL